MAKHATPLLDQLESGPWPSFVSDIKQEAAVRAKNPRGIEYQIPVDCPEAVSYTHLDVYKRQRDRDAPAWAQAGAARRGCSVQA